METGKMYATKPLVKTNVTYVTVSWEMMARSEGSSWGCISLRLRRALSLYLLAAYIPPCTLIYAISSGQNDVSRQSDLKSFSCGASQNVCDNSGYYLPAT